MRRQILKSAAFALAAGSLTTIAQAQTITTIFSSNNGGTAGGGVYFQIAVGASPITITSVDTNTSAVAGTAIGARLYTAAGTYAGNEANAGAWTQVANGTGTSAGTDLPTALALDAPIILAPNTSYGFCISLSTTSGVPAAAAHRYSGTGTNPAPALTTYSNPDLTLNLGTSTNVLFSGTPFNPRVWNGTLHYSVGGTVGACCLGAPSYACVTTTQASCGGQGGTYAGDGVTCANANCPPPPTGACCLSFGGCAVMTQLACTTAGGTYGGDNVACANANCPASGRCCFTNDSCFVMTSAQCVAAGGTYGGDNSSCSTSSCAAVAGNISCNGPYITATVSPCIPSPSLGSELKDPNTIFGFNMAGALRVADDFTVPAGETWTVNGFTVYGYQTGGVPPTSSFTSGTCQIWNGRPGDVGATVVAGDAVSNVLTGSDWTDVYRWWAGGCTTTRPIFANQLTLAAPAVLTAGTYWVDFNTAGSIASGPWVVPVTLDGLLAPPGGNARQFNAAWVDMVDGATRQEAMFCIKGSTGGGGCYANCDGSTGTPQLTANDFQCFLNKYAAGCS